VTQAAGAERDAPTRPDAAPAEQAVERLRGQGVRGMLLTLVDNAGVTRVKTVPLSALASSAARGVGLSPLFTVFTLDDHIASTPGLDTPSGDMRLFPDLEAAVALAGLPGWGWAPVLQRDQEGELLPFCQRGRVTHWTAAAAERGIAFKLAFEVEFSLLDAEGRPLHEGPGYSPNALLPANLFALDVFEALERQGIPVDQFHPEYSNGQYEVSVAPADPIAAADRYVLLRMTLRQLAAKYGWTVSFAPIVFAGSVGNGCHLHFSAWRDGRNLMSGGDGPAELAAEGEALAAGVLRRLYEMTAALAPTVLSYERLKPGLWAGAYTCWGHENREAALRLVQGMRPLRASSANFELKTIDGTSNPYLAVALLMAAALEGYDDDLRLPVAVGEDPALLSDEIRGEAGIRRLPADLGAAIDGFADSAFCRSALGDRLFDAFLAVRRYEWEHFGTEDADAVRTSHLYRHG
jgi:glutamine synthetase